MRKALYAGFCLVLAMGIGCALTDYPVMVDSYSGETINTNGKALIMPGSQVATIWDDGADNLFWMIDQKADGSGVITTYNFFTTGGTYFQDFTYCEPAWNGCAIWTAQNGGDPFDGQWNQNCAGSRSLSYLKAYGARYYGECGRAQLTLDQRNTLLNTGSWLSDTEIAFYLHNGNTSLWVNNNAGVNSLVPFLGAITVKLDWQGRTPLATIDMTHPLLQNSRNFLADWNDRYGSGNNTVTLEFNGVSKSFDMAFISDSLRR
jgi:hypothetical protein